MCRGGTEQCAAALAAGAGIDAEGTSDLTCLARLKTLVARCVYHVSCGRPSDATEVFAYGSVGTALHIAAFHGHVACVDLFLQHGADVHSTRHSHRMTPLHLAAMRGHADIAAKLMYNGGTNPCQADPAAACYDTGRRRVAALPRRPWAHGCGLGGTPWARQAPCEPLLQAGGVPPGDEKRVYS